VLGSDWPVAGSVVSVTRLVALVVGSASIGSMRKYHVQPGEYFTDECARTWRFADRGGSKDPYNVDVFKDATAGTAYQSLSSNLLLPGFGPGFPCGSSLDNFPIRIDARNLISANCRSASGLSRTY